MMGRKQLALAATLGGVIAFAGSAPPSVAGPERCRAIDSRTVSASDTIRVYRSRRGKTVACWKRSGRRIPLDPAFGGIRVDDVNSRYVAYVIHETGDHEEKRVEVMDVRRQRVIIHGSAYDLQTPEHPAVEVGRASLFADGSVAWIARNYGTPERPFDVYLVRSPGKPGTAVLDSGADVQLDSLALNGRYVYWSRGGSPKRAVISQ